VKSTLVILGSHPGTREDFDWSRSDCDVYTFNEAASVGSWVQWTSAVFQMHIPAIWKNPLNRNDKDHFEWLKGENNPPIYMLEKYDGIPQAIAYPLREVVDNLLANFRHTPSVTWRNDDGYFTSTVAYAIALGIYKGYTAIEFYGVEMAINTEYLYQRPCVAFWIGLAIGKDIKITFNGSMFDSPLYGYEGDIVIRKDIFVEQYDKMLTLAEAKKKEYEDAKEATSELIDRLIDKQASEAAVLQAVKVQMGLAQDFGRYDGAAQEHNRYHLKAEEMIKAASDFRFSRTEFEQNYRKLGEAYQEAYSQAQYNGLKLEKSFKMIGEADGYKKHLKAGLQFLNDLDVQIQFAVRVAVIDAAASVNAYYMNLMDEMMRAAGGEKSREVLENDDHKFISDPV
jgi:hypothetical protein